MDYTMLSKEISYALRHVPWEYELEMDDQGWVPLKQLLIDGLRVRIEVLYGFFTLFFAEQLRFSAMVGLSAEHAQ